MTHCVRRYTSCILKRKKKLILKKCVLIHRAKLGKLLDTVITQ